VSADQQQSSADEGPIELSFRLPPIGAHALVRCPGFRCLAYRDADGNWRDSHHGDILSDVIEVIPDS
jgi:hypothetical protein